MLRLLIVTACVIACTTTFAHSESIKRCKHNERFQNWTSVTNVTSADFPTTLLHTFNDKTSLKMLEDITAKVWRILPVISVPRSWALPYCMKHTEISEEIEKAIMQCQHDGTDWDCTFIELGGGESDFNIGKVVSLFHGLSDQALKSKLLRGAEMCGKLWQTYKEVQDKRLTRMRVNVHVKTREKRYSKKNKNVQGNLEKRSKKSGKNVAKKKDEKRGKSAKKPRQAAKEMKIVTKQLENRIKELESKELLKPEEQAELNGLRLAVTSKPRVNFEEYSVAEERAELSRLEEIGSCLTQQTTKACESIILDTLKKVM